MKTNKLDEIAKSLRESGILPSFDPDESRLLIHLWRTLARGQALPDKQVNEIATSVQVSQDVATSVLHRTAERDDEGHETAIGGKNISQTIERRERYPINVRYARELRDDLESLKRVLVTAPSGAQIPLAQLADISKTNGPPSIRDENGALAGIVFVDVAGRDLGSYVAEVKELIRQRVTLPSGYSLGWGGHYQYMERAKARLMLVVPLTILLIFVLLYLNFHSVARSLIVLLSVPFALIGAVWTLAALDYNLSVAVGVGIIALAGVAAEIGILVLDCSLSCGAVG